MSDLTPDFPNPERGPLTAGAVLQRLDKIADATAALIAQAQRPKREMRHTVVGAGNLDGSGDGQFLMYTVQEGFDFTLNRLVLTAPGFTPAAPMTVAYISVNEDAGVDASGTLVTGAAVDFAPVNGGTVVIPVISTDNRHQAWTYTAGRSVILVVNGGTAGAVIGWRLKGYLLEA